MRVLLTTDHPSLRDAATAYLALHGVESVALEGDAAILCAGIIACRPDAVLIEWRRGRGWADAQLVAAAATVRARPEELPIVALCPELDREAAQRAGADYCVAIGGRPEALLAMLKEAVAAT